TWPGPARRCGRASRSTRRWRPWASRDPGGLPSARTLAEPPPHQAHPSRPSPEGEGEDAPGKSGRTGAAFIRPTPVAAYAPGSTLGSLRMSSFVLYLIGMLIVIGGLAYGASLAGLSTQWI